MKLFIFFGLPGAGKSYAGEIAKHYFGYYHYDGDADLTPELHSALQNQATVTDEMRDIFFTKLLKSVKKLSAKYDKLVISQTFIKEKYRIQFLQAFPQAKFVLFKADDSLREKRFQYSLGTKYAQAMSRIFEKPHVSHYTIENNTIGNNKIKEKLKKILA